MQLAVAELVAAGSVRLVDGTLLSCANYAGCAAKSALVAAAALQHATEAVSAANDPA